MGAVSYERSTPVVRCQERGEQLKGLTDSCLEDSSSQGQNMALTVSVVPSSLDSGLTALERIGTYKAVMSGVRTRLSGKNN